MALGLGLALLGTMPASAAGPRSLRPVQGADRVDALEAGPGGPCGEQVRDELRQGRRGDGCVAERLRVGEEVVRGRDAFGFVERQQVDLVRLRLTLGWARRCDRWPLRHPDHDVLRRTEVAAAGCRLGRYEGPVPVVFFDHQGRRHQPLEPLRSDRDGRLTIRFAAIDRTLRSLGAGALEDYARIELGEGAWAGHVDLEQLLAYRADWHLTWVSRGRGAPGLFAVRHPEHPGASEARTMAAEALLARQLADYERVREGQLPARSFFDWYVRSPYHRQLRAWLRARGEEEASGEEAPRGPEAEAERERGSGEGSPEREGGDVTPEPEPERGGDVMPDAERGGGDGSPESERGGGDVTPEAEPRPSE